MKRVESYIVENFLSFFWSFFLTLFSISSLILIIRLADLTSIANIDLADFATLYLFGVPQLLFYTLPIAFFLSMGLSLSKLSFDRELVALFALGVGVRELLIPIIKIAVMFSATLLVLGYFLNPYSSAVAKNFIENKKGASSLNVKASEAGQKFGDWLVFVSGEEKDGFSDTVLFSTSSKASLIEEAKSEKNSTTMILAKNAKIFNENGIPSLLLANGKGYKIEDLNSSKLLYFKEMKIMAEPKNREFEAADFVAYWMQAKDDKKRAKDFSDVFLTSMFPILSLFFIPAIGIVNPRYQKNRAPLYFIAVIALFYTLMLSINPVFTYYGIALIAPAWFFAGLMLYKKSGAARF
ncbi:MAG: LptF/LptG family permease [Campylobacteraceae bacterium]|nr:LptF/LptG family permease [Campylobacteraceae bacterium]